jgi:hypothetical protein
VRGERAPFFDAYAVGLVSASVCTDLPLDEATAWLNEQYPTGLRHGWTPAEEATFADGRPQPGPCESAPARTHYLFHC